MSGAFNVDFSADLFGEQIHESKIASLILVRAGEAREKTIPSFLSHFASRQKIP